MPARSAARCGGLVALVALAWFVPGSAPAQVNPMAIIDDLVRKPNILIVLDTSASMPETPGFAMGNLRDDVGPDCDNSDPKTCRILGWSEDSTATEGRCYFARNKCTCPSNVFPCAGATWRQNDGSWITGTCASIKPNNYTFGNDFCSNRNTPQASDVVKMCEKAQVLCRDDSNCTSVPGDRCGPATSRLVAAKRVLRNMVSNFQRVANFGFMTFYKGDMYKYYEAGDTAVPGLRGEYYSDRTFTTLRVARVDANVNFSWGTGSPDPSMGVDNFSVRWTGKVIPKFSQAYTFCTRTDDGVRLWVNNVLLVDKWIDQGPTEYCGTTAVLTANQEYDIRMEYYENGGGAVAELRWQSSSQAKEIIPQSQLKTAAGGSTTQSYTLFYSRLTLYNLGCWDPYTGPKNTCVIRGISHTLKPTLSSRYLYRDPKSEDYKPAESDWCGRLCALTGLGTGYYAGSWYSYTVTSSGKFDDTKPFIIEPTYQGKTLEKNGKKYIYLEARPYQKQPGNKYQDPSVNGRETPITEILMSHNCDQPNWCGQTCRRVKGDTCTVAGCKNAAGQCLSWENEACMGGDGACGPACGGKGDWVPPLDPSGNPATQQAQVLAITDRLADVSQGGVPGWGPTPSGCTLLNAGSTNPNHSAYYYMDDVKKRDTGPESVCRLNYVLFVTDGMPNSNGESGSGCANSNCNVVTNPSLSGCACRSVTAADRIFRDLGVKTLVVGYSGTLSNADAVAYLRHLALAGRTMAPFASEPGPYTAISEVELQTVISRAIFAALARSYATSPPSASAGSIQDGELQFGKLLLDARVDFPSWAGHLIFYDLEGGLKYDAATVSFPTCEPNAAPTDRCKTFWRNRNVWTYDDGRITGQKGMVRIAVDASGNMDALLKTRLRRLGLGATDDEAFMIARWMLGDPALNNPAVLGALVGSTPIDVGPPTTNQSKAPGAQAFHDTHKTRPYLTYVGSSNGMLHAFYTFDQGTRKGGEEAFAFIPPNMLPRITELYVQNGQLPDPKDHLFGVASSPKVKDLCVRYCDGQSGTPEWKTVLVIGQGLGGKEMYQLDITTPLASPPVSVRWTSEGDSNYDPILGNTISVPGYYYAKASENLGNDYRIIYASGYGDPAQADQGRTLVNTSLVAPYTLLDKDTVTPPVSCATGQSYTILTDVATAKNWDRSQHGQLLAAYFGDTFGNLWRYVPTLSGGLYTAGGSVSRVDEAGCSHPLHFAPAVVQLDRNNPGTPTGDIYLVQPTNSVLDAKTRGFPASQLVFRRDKALGGSVTPDLSFGTSGRTVVPVTDMCINSTDGTCQSCTCAVGSVSCDPTKGHKCRLPATARPVSTPVAILKADNQGFQVYTVWYVAPTNACAGGMSYITGHEVGVSGQIGQKAGAVIGSEPVAGTTFVGGKMYYTSEAGGAVDITSRLGQNFNVGGGSSGPPPGQERFKKLGWTELP